jgi:hypothetical protein
MSKKYIAFIGDSFCASARSPDLKRKHYPEIVANHYGFNILAHGYAGKSWWYSRQRFMEDFKQNPGLEENIEAMVFCHTNSGRFNTSNEHVFFHSDVKFQRILKDDNKSILMQAQKYWFKYLIDYEFQDWAQMNWFRETSREWGHIKQVHFHCFPWSILYNHLLTGQRFTTPLIHVSMGELSGTAKEIDNYLKNNETRPNHFSNANNAVLAEIIIDALDNYADQSQPLDISKFKNIINPNAVNFDGLNNNFGTR